MRVSCMKSVFKKVEKATIYKYKYIQNSLKKSMDEFF